MNKSNAICNAIPICLLLASSVLLLVPSISSQPQRQSSSAENQSQIHVEVDLVQVPVTVTDPYGRIVTGFEKKDFHIFEDGVEQEILNFSEEDVPVSIALVLDVSGSMADKMPIVRTGAVEFLRNGNPRDEFMVVDFRTRPHVLNPFTSDAETLQSNMLYLTSHGSTALLDAMHLALVQIHSAHNPRRAIILVSDGGENHSWHSKRGVERMFREADTQFYAIFVPPEGELGGADLMRDLAQRSGGRFFHAAAGSIPDMVQKVGDELRSEYVLAYRPANHPPDGRWHKIRVQLAPQQGLPALNVYARYGYTAPRH